MPGCLRRITYEDGRYRDYAYDDLYRLTREERNHAQDLWRMTWTDCWLT